MRHNETIIRPGLMSLGIDGGTSAQGLPSLRRLRFADGGESSARCVNLRSCDGGGLEAVRLGRRLFSTADPVVMADSRDDLRNFFTLGPDLKLRLAIVAGADGRVEKRGDLIATLPAGIEQWAVCGEFLVLRLADSSLYYLLWHPDERRYSALGRLPGFGTLRVEKRDETQITSEIGRTRFSSVVPDPREGNASAYGSAAVGAVEDALRRGMETARQSGYWVQPVAVRVVWRLWDGSILHQTEAAVAADASVQTGGRVLLPLTHSDKGYTGTAASVLTLPAYRLGVMIDGGIPAAWSDVVSSVEVWVSQEPDPLVGEASVGLHTGAQELALTVSLRGKSLAEIMPEATGGLMERMERTEPGAATADRTVARLPVAGAVMDPVLSAPGMPAEATAVEGHGGWLHSATAGEVFTSCRGNPFVRAGYSRSPGGRIAAMAAQPVGGGAYTRQYLYLFTDRGIVGLTHDSDGRHRNVRMVSQLRVGGRGSVASGSGGVYALGESGTLVRLRDSSVATIARGLRGYGEMVCEPRHNELWIFGRGFPCWLSLNLDTGSEAGASLRDAAWESCPRECGGCLYVLGASGVDLLEADDGDLAAVEWESFADRIGSGGAVSVGADLRGAGMAAGVGILLHDDHGQDQDAEGTVLGKMTVSGSHSGTSRCGMMLPPAFGARLSVRVSGRLTRLGAVSIGERVSV